MQPLLQQRPQMKLAAAKRSLLALVVQIEERKVILAQEQTLNENGREMAC